MSPRNDHRRAPAVLALVAALLGGCTGGDDGTDDTGTASATTGEATPEAPRDERIAAVRTAREALGPAAVELADALGTARATVLDALAVDGDPAVRAGAASTASELVDERLAEATATASRAATDVERTDDTAAALDLLADARRATETWATTATDLLERPGVVAADLEAIAAIAEGWDEPASRGVQVERLGGLGEEAEAYAEAVAQRAEDNACWSTSEVVARAASNVASASFELRDLAESFEGNTFDDRRDALRDDPLGLPDEALPSAAAEDAACLSDDQLAVPEPVAILADALGDALSPEDLSTG